jgi:hypothetical protein
MAVSYKDPYGTTRQTGSGYRLPTHTPERSSRPQGARYYAYGQWFNTPGDVVDFRGMATGMNLTPQQLGGVAKNWGDQAPTNLAQIKSDYGATQQAQANNQQAQDTLQGTYDTYLGKYWNPARDQAIATHQQAIQQYLDSPAQTALTKYADPNYQAMSDQFVDTQRVAANRAITKDQQDAIAASVANAGGRGYDGSGLVPAATMAAGFRGAGDRANLAATLASDQLQFNQDQRMRATGLLSDRDAQAARMRGDLAAVEGAVPPINPYAGLIAQLKADAPVWMPDLLQYTEQGDVDRVLDTLGMTREAATEALNSSLEWAVANIDRAETEQEKAEISEWVNTVIVPLVNLLGNRVFPGG